MLDAKRGFSSGTVFSINSCRKCMASLWLGGTASRYCSIVFAFTGLNMFMVKLYHGFSGECCDMLGVYE